MRGGKTRPKTGFYFNLQKRPVPESSGASLAKRPDLESWIVAGSLLVVVSISSADARKKGSHGGSVFLISYSPQPHHHFLLLCRLVCFSIFWISGGTLLPTGLCLKWFMVTILSLGHVLPCSVISSSSVLRQLQFIIPLSR